ncbi:hypothetical protein T492DRAFT_567345, partial [Pavlovales sp. CCMP2436]
PGECWAAQGHSARLLVRLASPLRPEAFSLDHLPPGLAYDLRSAPRALSVWGGFVTFSALHSREGGRGGADSSRDEVDDGREAGSDEEGGVFEWVELQVESNHGHPNYTALYRFRVH